MTPDEEKELIRIDNVSHTFNTITGTLPVLKNLTLSVPENGFTAIVGPSGCGKSTVTRLVAGLLKPNSGSIWLQGKKWLLHVILLGWLSRTLFFLNGAAF